MSHGDVILGVDAGGTSTRAVLATPRGDAVGYGLGGRGNPISAGVELATDGVMTAIRAALGPDGALADVSVIAAAMAGQRPGEGEGGWLRARLAEEGFTGALTFESDLMAMYSSGSAEDFGYAVVAGTGASAVRVRGGAIEAAGDGLGWLLGDHGGGFWIGHRVVRAVGRELDGAGPETALTPAVLAHLGIIADLASASGRRQVLEQIVETLYARRPIELAALAPLAFAVDDPIADGILRQAGEHLADTLAGVVDGPGPVVIGGSVLVHPGAVRDAFTRRVDTCGVALELRTVIDGAVGAGLLALRSAGVPVTSETLGRLSASVARFR